MINSSPSSFHSTLENGWLWLLANYSEATLLLWGTFILHEIVYFGRFLPYRMLDYIPWFRQFKIQEDKTASAQDVWKATKGVLFNHFFVQLPMIYSTHFVTGKMGLKMTLPLPSFKTLAWQIPVFLIIEDFYEYVAHRAMHENAWVYKHIHKMHHDFKMPFGLTAEYAHPVETVVLGFGTSLGLFVIAPLSGLHVFTIWLWMVVRMLQAIDAHCGYDFPWSLRHIIPFWSGSEFHDFHHQKFVGNYASSFRIWDRVFGTDVQYKNWKASKKGAEKLHAQKSVFSDDKQKQ